MDDINVAEIHEDAAAELTRLKRGMIFNAALIKGYADILIAAGLSDSVILIAIEQWCRARNRIEVEPMIHHMYMQQHQAHESTPDA